MALLFPLPPALHLPRPRGEGISLLDRLRRIRLRLAREGRRREVRARSGHPRRRGHVRGLRIETLLRQVLAEALAQLLVETPPPLRPRRHVGLRELLPRLDLRVLRLRLRVDGVEQFRLPHPLQPPPQGALYPRPLRLHGVRQVLRVWLLQRAAVAEQQLQDHPRRGLARDGG